MDTGYQHAAIDTGYHHAAMDTGYHHAAMDTGYQHAAMDTGYQHAAMDTGYQHAAMKLSCLHPPVMRSIATRLSPRCHGMMMSAYLTWKGHEHVVCIKIESTEEPLGDGAHAWTCWHA